MEAKVWVVVVVVLCGLRGSEGDNKRCPYNCGGHGTCTNGACFCLPGWYGPNCKMPLSDISDGQVLNGTVSYGNWNYYGVSVTTLIPALQVDVTWNGNLYPQLYIKQNSYPLVDSYDFANLTTTLGSKSFIISFPSISKWYIGVTTSLSSETSNSLVSDFTIKISFPNYCPANCFSRGICDATTGNCQCIPPYHGPDCSSSYADITLDADGNSLYLNGTSYLRNFDYWVVDPSTVPFDPTVPRIFTVSLNTYYKEELVQLEEAGWSDPPSPIFIKLDAPPTLFSYDYFFNQTNPRATSLQFQVYIDALGYSKWYIGIWGRKTGAYTLRVQYTIPCPDNCFGNGICIKGQCKCNIGYLSPNCHKHERNVALNTDWTDTITDRSPLTYSFVNTKFKSEMSFTFYDFQYSNGQSFVIIITLNTVENGRSVYYRRMNCTLADDGHCIMTVTEMPLGGYKLGVILVADTNSGLLSYNVISEAASRCPNDCFGPRNGQCWTLIPLSPTCICHEHYAGDDCGLYLQQQTLPATNTFPNLPSNSWIYFGMEFNTSLIDLTVDLQYNVKTLPISIYLFYNEFPTELTYFTKISYLDAEPTAPFNERTLVSGFNVPSGKWYCGLFTGIIPLSSPSISFKWSTCSGKSCQCPQGKTGLKCEFPYLPIQANDLRSDFLYPTTGPDHSAWHFYWIYFSNPTPIVIYVEENPKDPEINLPLQGNVWVFADQQRLPDLKDNRYFDIDPLTLHTIYIPSTVSTGNWTIGLHSSPQLTSPIRYTLVVQTGCSAYRKITNCLSDKLCKWCYNSWVNRDGLCVPQSQVTRCLYEQTQINDISVNDGSKAGLMFGATVGGSVFLIAVIVIVILWRRSKDQIPEKEPLNTPANRYTNSESTQGSLHPMVYDFSDQNLLPPELSQQRLTSESIKEKGSLKIKENRVESKLVGVPLINEEDTSGRESDEYTSE
eukprot:TRINITY_DN1729_c1_g1_i1.p1 TRINITY_DN1729_c1_g1~~TRINITY_DN1729_c1_g1_i1.p1  ORF type:complete len:950 (+),score=177.09 TRINITY_DN1729_c1_g1_i1:42-2891(+)